MSASGGKADINYPSVKSPLIAKSGHLQHTIMTHEAFGPMVRRLLENLGNRVKGGTARHGASSAWRTN